MRQRIGRIFLMAWMCLLLVCPAVAGAAEQASTDEYQAYHWVLDAVEELGTQGESRRVTGEIQTVGVHTFFAINGHSDEEKQELIREKGGMTLSLALSNGSTQVEHRYEWSPLPLRIGQRLLSLEIAGDIRSEKGTGALGTALELLLNRQSYGVVSANAYEGAPAQRQLVLDIPAPTNQGRTTLIQLRAEDQYGSLTHTVSYYYRAEPGPAPEPTPVPTATPTQTPDPTPSPRPTGTPEPSPIATATASPTVAATRTPRVTPVPTPTLTITPAPTGTPNTPKESPTPFAAVMDALMLPVFERMAAPKAEVPAYYAPAEAGQESLFVFQDPEGQQRYRLYGSMDGVEPAFYPSDAMGRIAAGADAIVLSEEEKWMAGAAPTTDAATPSPSPSPRPTVSRAPTVAPSPAPTEAATPELTPEGAPEDVATTAPQATENTTSTPETPPAAAPESTPPETQTPALSADASAEPTQERVPVAQLEKVVSGIPWWVFGIVAAIVVVVAALIPGKKK